MRGLLLIPSCFNGLPYHCGFPQIKIVCQQIRGIPFECFSTRRTLPSERPVQLPTRSARGPQIERLGARKFGVTIAPRR
jgi:hypothetical protein